MIISHKHKFVFIKTRKTAGSTFEKLIYPHLCRESGDICTGSEQDGTPEMNRRGPFRGHSPFKKAEEHIDKSYWIFTIERNPWDKVVSQFFYMNSWSGDLILQRCLQDFKLFQNYPNDYLKYESAMGYDFSVFKFEEMNVMYRMLYKKTGIDIPKNLVEKTKLKGNFRLVKDYKTMYNGLHNKVKEIGKVFLPEIQLLGYKYD